MAKQSDHVVSSSGCAHISMPYVISLFHMFVGLRLTKTSKSSCDVLFTLQCVMGPLLMFTGFFMLS